MKKAPDRDYEPAFPARHEVHGARIQYAGMSLRDYFAGQALAMLANTDSWANYPDLATRCYAAADAMLTERAK